MNSKCVSVGIVLLISSLKLIRSGNIPSTEGGSVTTKPSQYPGSSDATYPKKAKTEEKQNSCYETPKYEKDKLAEDVSGLVIDNEEWHVQLKKYMAEINPNLMRAADISTLSYMISKEDQEKISPIIDKISKLNDGNKRKADAMSSEDETDN